MIKALLNNIIGQNQNYSSYKMDSPKSQDSTAVVVDSKKALTLEGTHNEKIVVCGLSNMRSAHKNSMNLS